MIKVINWMSFLGALLKGCAQAFKEFVPAWKELKKANELERFTDEKTEKKVSNESL